VEPLNVIIVTTLGDYGRVIPIDFLAKRLRRSRGEIIGTLDNLETAGVIQRDSDSVGLVKIVSES